MTRYHLSTALAAVLVLAGCNRAPEADGNATAAMVLPELPATLPLDPGPAGAIDVAPAVSDLPEAPPLRLAQVADPADAYGYADAAYGYDAALADSPPDYAFDYADADPWAWQAYDGSTMFAEPIDDGYRYYYYRPGADEPYFIRDPYYSYGFAGGMLAAVYALDGGIVPYGDYGPRLGYASRYYARGRDLYLAGRRAQRRPVIAGVWLARRPVILASRERWGAGRERQPLWASYHRANQPRLQRYWEPERVRRAADSERFAGWRQAGLRGTPPPRAIPAAWTRERWAQDTRRFRPAADNVRERVAREDRRDARTPAADRRQERREDAQSARADRRDGRNRPEVGTERESRAERLAERREGAEARQQNARRNDARERREAQRAAAQTRREQARAERPRAEARRDRPADRRNDQAQGEARAQAQARREQAQAQRQAAQERRQETRQRPAPAERADRQRERAERSRFEGPERPDRQRADAAERAQRQEQQRAAQAERAQRQRDDGERAQRQQQAQAERAARQAQAQAEGRQRQQAAQQAQQRQQQRAAEPRPATQPQRQQAREERQQNRAERREARGDRN